MQKPSSLFHAFALRTPITQLYLLGAEHMHHDLALRMDLVPVGGNLNIPGGDRSPLGADCGSGCGIKSALSRAWQDLDADAVDAIFGRAGV